MWARLTAAKGYGKDGKPFYIKGPNESVNQAKRIVDTLSKRHADGIFTSGNYGRYPDP